MYKKKISKGPTQKSKPNPMDLKKIKGKGAFSRKKKFVSFKHKKNN